MTYEVEFQSKMGVELLQYMGDDEFVAKAARVSTGKDQETQEKISGLIRYLARERHTVPFEHLTATFRIEAPLFVRDQIIRHRTFSFSVKSLRYTEAAPKFYVPADFRPLKNAGTSARPNMVLDPNIDVADIQTEHKNSAQFAWDTYQYMLEHGAANEVARNVLPASTYTAFYMTGNLLNWSKMIWLRGGYTGHPQQEVAAVAGHIENALNEIWPLSLKALMAGDER